MIFTFLRSNSGFIFAMYPSSVVQTGVKSFGCENRMAQELPIQSWKRIGPSVVSASKSGAVSPIFICFFLRCCTTDKFFSSSEAKVNTGVSMPLHEKIRIQTLREVHPIRMETLFRDVRYGIRQLRKHTAFTILAIISLALGIGANTAIFSLVNTVLLRPLPVKEPSRLIEVYGALHNGADFTLQSHLNYKDYRDRNDVFSGLFA